MRRPICVVLLLSALLGGACSDQVATVADAGLDSVLRDATPHDGFAIDGLAIDGGADGKTDAPAAACPLYDPQQIVGTVTAAAINEASGMVASRQQSDVLWLHNDSGDSARVFAIDTMGQLLGTFKLQGAAAQDWEDIALGPGPQAGVDYLYLGDIGDNAEARASIAIYRVAEPTVSAGGGTQDVAGVDKLTFVYPDGAHNAETLLIDPRQGDLYIITKSNTAVSLIFRAAAPLVAGQQRTLEQVGTLRFREGVLANVGSGLATGGDVAPDGRAVILRTYKDVLYWRVGPTQALAAALVAAPCSLPQATEGQGETVALVAGGDYFTLSEGKSQPLYRYRAR